jgi:lipopolysaccharide export system permease protein
MIRLRHYLIREVLKPFLVVVAILVGLFTSFNAARYLAETVTETLGMVLIMKLILLKSVIAMEVLVPIAFYSAIIVALARLHRDQEVIVIRSAGISENFIVRTLFSLSLPVALLVGLLSIYGRPWAYQHIYLLDESESAEMDISRYQPRRFYGNDKSGTIIYIQNKTDAEENLQNVFHYVRKDGSSDIVIAKQGHQERLEFSRFVYMPSPEIARDYQRKAASTVELSFSEEPRDVAEFQWRVSRALAAILLAMIAIPLSRSSPRQGKGEKIITAAIIFAIYYNLNGLAQTWVEQGLVGKMPGVWWLHILMILVVFAIYTPKAQKALYR